MAYNGSRGLLVSSMIGAVFLILLQGCFADAGDPAFLVVPRERFTVTFADGGAVTPAVPAVMTVTRPLLTVSNLPVPPALTGFGFGGWYTGTNGSGAVFTVESLVASNMTVYPRWVCTLAYDSLGGSAVTPQTRTGSNWQAVEPYDPERPTYVFAGWYKETNCITPWDFTTDRVASNTTIYAKWTPASYTVTYVCTNGSGGSVPPPSVHPHGSPVVVAANSGGLTGTRDGISGLTLGWTTNVLDTSFNLVPGSGSFIMPTNNITVYARWSAIGCTGPAGGKIFYDKWNTSDGWRYLEAAPTAAIHNTYTWCTRWNTGIYDQTIGAGYPNSEALINWMTTYSSYARPSGTEVYAVDYCWTLYSYGGKSDWFLPSVQELQELARNKALFGGVITSGFYVWSSAQAGNEMAYVVNLDTGNSHNFLKDSVNRTWPVRRF